MGFFRFVSSFIALLLVSGSSACYLERETSPASGHVIGTNDEVVTTSSGGTGGSDDGASGTGGTGARRGRPPKSETQAHLPPELKAMQESLSSDLGAPVEIQKNANNGKITITFYSEEELENILRRLGKET